MQHLFDAYCNLSTSTARTRYRICGFSRLRRYELSVCVMCAICTAGVRCLGCDSKMGNMADASQCFTAKSISPN